ncbi:MAG: tRNA pseudouridine(55) synthase TruB [Ruminococcaceae bacterium]|nr:tRNA pseudouridine(55) synthase TruB [Oscillospiraceae bacterium]
MLNGILVVDKPKDFTSHDVIGKMRGILKMRQIGHAGTLDPIATGVLIVLLGKATRASDYLMAEQKEYVAKLILGKTTDTQDITGNVLTESEVSVTEEQFIDAMNSFIGDIEQIPPMYSAIQIGGKRLYDLARKGIEVERKSRLINIAGIELLNHNGSEYEIKIACSKGTYIRTLCHDIGAKLGCGATMTELRRVKSGNFIVEKACTIDDIQNGRVLDFLIPTERAFETFNKVTLNEAGMKRALNGAFLDKSHISEGVIPEDGETVTVFTSDGKFMLLGMGGKLDKGGNCIFCKKSFM